MCAPKLFFLFNSRCYYRLFFVSIFFIALLWRKRAHSLTVPVSLRDCFCGCFWANTSVRPYGFVVVSGEHTGSPLRDMWYCSFVYFCAHIYVRSVLLSYFLLGRHAGLPLRVCGCFGRTHRFAPTPRTFCALCSSVLLFFFGRTHRFAPTGCGFWADTPVCPYGFVVVSGEHTGSPLRLRYYLLCSFVRHGIIPLALQATPPCFIKWESFMQRGMSL